MKTIKKYYSLLTRISLAKRIILFYFVFIFLPGCFLMYLYYEKSSAIIERNLNDSMLQTLKQAEINIDYRLTNIENVSNTLISNPDIFRFLTNVHTSNAVQFNNFLEMDKAIISAENQRDIHSIRFFVQPELYYAEENIHFFPLSNLQKHTEWYENVMNANGKIFWKSTYRERFIGKEDAFVTSNSRILRDPNNFDKIIGVLVIDMVPSILQDILEQMTLYRSQVIYILDANGQVISHTDPIQLGKKSMLNDDQLALLWEQQAGYFNDHRDSSPVYTIFQRISTNGWVIVAEIPANEISGESVALTKISIVIVLATSFIVFLFVLALVFAYVVKKMSIRIRDLIRMMKKGGLELLDRELPSQESSFLHLEQSISSIIQTVKDLSEESYQARLQEHEARLKALQAQINPHFLYNTLDSINWMAIRRNASEISSMIDSLSKYFRLSLNQGKDIVTLDEELQLIDVYLRIQNIRFSDSIHVEYHVDPRTLSCKLPNLTLQPIVENAVLHGIQFKKPKNGVIVISCMLEGEDLKILVEDDGVGMNNAQTEQLLFPPSLKSNSGYGLYNVQERIRLYSRHSRYGISIRSQPGSGTCVELLLSANTPN